MININDCIGINDNDIIDNAIKNRGADGVVVISKRVSDIEPERDYWLLDRAITIPEDTTIVLQNCMLKLSDKCRDNFFRSANCGLGIEDPEKISNIHIHGVGLCILQGADNPRATGDGSKILANPCPFEPEDLCKYADWIPEERRTLETLGFWDAHNHSCGTDAGKEGESQYGDWRGIGILFANVDNFSISNLKIVESHGWAISVEACTNGRIEKIEFDARMSKMINGMRQNMENQDGVDIRNGCHHIIISDITGKTGDDVIALTAIADTDEYMPGGSLRTTHVMHNDWSRRERDIHDIIIRNVIAYSHLCFTLRLLPANAKIYNIVVDGIIDVASPDKEQCGTMTLGDSGYGINYPDGLRGVTISNVVCNSNHGIIIGGYLKDSVITNLINKNPNCDTIEVEREDGIENVLISNLCQYPKE